MYIYNVTYRCLYIHICVYIIIYILPFWNICKNKGSISKVGACIKIFTDE